MIIARIDGATHDFGAPPDWNAAEHGPCQSLPVRVSGAVFQSAWRPSPEELEMLAAGGVVLLSVVGGQPPVMLGVEMPKAAIS